jgi:hypothetical protein
MSDQANFSLSDGARECDSCGRALDWRDECGCVECSGLPFCELCAERHLEAHLAGIKTGDATWLACLAAAT